ncbi:MAG TPA: hypothetical protein PK869_08625 [Candidatus Hydrogenedentes bacterium]|nr:hypothetical protein [Candidatus Hydrogenedentota bacterium]
MSPDEKKIARLAKLAETLNSETDSLNDIFAQFEAQITGMNLGVSAWVEKWLLGQEGPFVREDHHGNEIGKYFTGEFLGFTKHDGKWRLCTQSVEIEADDEGGHHEGLVLSRGDIRLLQNEPRHIRAEAAGHLDRLIDALMAQSELYIRNIQRAKEAASK